MARLTPHETLITDLLLVRHGQTDWNVERRIQGWEPVPLNDTGRAQARAAASLLADLKPAAVVSSPVLRAVQTAEILKDALGWPDPVETHPGFGEFRMGDWDGKALSELWGAEAWRFYLDHPAETTFPRGESLADIRARAIGAANAVVSEKGGGSVVIVSHGGIVRLLTMAAYGLPLARYHSTHVDNASITHIRLLPTRPARVLAVNRHGDPLRPL